VELLPRAALAFAELADNADGWLTAVVHTARPLAEGQPERLAQALSGALGRQVRLRQVVEPGLLAGARVEVGGRTFDGSVLGGLERLKGHLVAALAR
jgi:F-type H+-transporting ATPase subunit delta